MGVEAWLLDMAKMQCNIWDEDGQETGAICEMATDAVWRRVPCNTIPPPDGSPQAHKLPITHAKHTPDQFVPRLTTDNPATRDMHTEAIVLQVR